MIKSRGRECDKVIRSLVSGFPNEVDFALNVLTMMSFEKPESIPIIKVMLYMYRYMHVHVYLLELMTVVGTMLKCIMLGMYNQNA